MAVWVLLVATSAVLVFSDANSGQPLFLTPYIESGMTREARVLARVPLTYPFGIESYSGFFTVNKFYNSNMFFWYFPAVHEPTTAPVVLWLQGGPGSSSLNGLFKENGPLQIKNERFALRDIHWALNHHVIFIDNPVGSGFSFTGNPLGYCRDEQQVGLDLYTALVQFFQMFPELQIKDFFVTGESYAGKYVPALGYTIHMQNPTADIKIKLAGLAIGNGITDPINQLGYSEYFYQLGLVDNNGKQVIKEYETLIASNILNKQWDEAYVNFNKLIMTDENSLLYNLTGIANHYSFLYLNSEHDYNIRPMLEGDETRMSLHVGNIPFDKGVTAQSYLREDVMKSITPWLEILLEHYEVLMFNGQLDLILAYPMMVNYLQKLHFPGSVNYRYAQRHLWTVEGEVAGYVKRAGNLIELLVRNAGHMVPKDQPLWALDMLTRFTRSKHFGIP